MKKFLMTIAAAFVAVSMSAQVYVGGELGFASVKGYTGDSETTFRFLPEVGYSFNEEWGIGVMLGYVNGYNDLQGNSFNANTAAKYFTLNPYARYTFFKSKLVSAFVDGGLDLNFPDEGDTFFGIGVKPGVALNLTDNLSFVTHLGFVGYKAQGDANKVGIDFNGNALTFGMYYSF